jgi:predicted SAM-dependent methyltransferase
VTHIFVENGVEYLTHQEAWKFFEECHRILIPNGFIRIAITDISEQWSAMTPKYRKKAKELGIGDGDAKSTIKAVIFKQGFQGCWNAKLLDTFLIAVGFKTYGSNVSHSRNIIEFNNLEVISDNFEPSIIEGTKV